MNLTDPPQACVVRCVLGAGYGNNFAVVYTNCACTLRQLPAWAVGNEQVTAITPLSPTSFKCNFGTDVSTETAATFPELSLDGTNPHAINFGYNGTWAHVTLVPEA